MAQDEQMVKLQYEVKIAKERIQRLEEAMKVAKKVALKERD